MMGPVGRLQLKILKFQFRTSQHNYVLIVLFQILVQKKYKLFITMKLVRRIINYNKNYFCMEGKRTKEAQGPLITESNKLGGNFHFKGKPAFIKDRNEMFNAIKKRIEQVYEKIEKPEINIKLKDGKQVKGQAFLTTPYLVAKGISKNLAEASIVARVKYLKKYDSPLGKGLSSAQAEDQQHDKKQSQFQLFDLNRPLEGDCLMELVSFDDKEGKEVFWHSSAHLLGQSLEQNFGAWLCHGPPLDQGFFYDSFMGHHRISQNDYDKIEQLIKKFAHEKQPYERIVLTKKQALQMFSYNPFKKQLIEAKIPEEGLTSAYRCGNLIDLCTGPHIPSAALVKGFKVTKNSSAYWLGKKQNDDLQRVYAISFPKQALLDQYVQAQQELAKRDHRNIGPRQDLFHFTTFSPGSALFYPHGTTIYTRLQQLMRGQYKIRGYNQVISPNVYSSQLWKISGHYFKYKQNIFWIRSQGQEFGLKPMNCPGHCVMFGLIQRSYKDLPIRMADFGVLHRNQLHGALSGLTRVRRFQQDDAHIFCRTDQIEQQIIGVLDLLDYIYSVFNFKYVLELSTRPDQFLGQLQDWNKAEKQLTEALNAFGKQYKINPGDGAFYGPKIDVKLFDVFGRQHQCGTIQLDFQLPQRFNLQFRAGKGVQQIKQANEQAENEEQNKKKQSEEKKQPVKQQQTKQQPKQDSKQQGKQAKQGKQEKQKGKKKGQKPQISAQQRQRLRQQKIKRKQQQAKKKEEQEKAKLQMQEKKDEISIVSGSIFTDIPDQQRYNKIQPVKNGFERPVIIHRAIFGSLERFIAILCEHTGGKWDFWLSPRQLKIIPLGKDHYNYAQQLKNLLFLKGFSVEIDFSGDKLDKKIRNAQIESFNFIGVIGQKQFEEKKITLRKRDENEIFGTLSIAELVKLFEQQGRPPKSKKRVEMQQKSLKI